MSPRRHGGAASDPRACVLGEIDLVRALALGGIRSAVVAPPGDFTRYSRAVDDVIEWADPARVPELVVERMLDWGRTQASPPVLYYDGDWDLLMISRFRDRLDECFRFVVGDSDVVERVVDKSLFGELSAAVGLPVPPAVEMSPATEEPHPPLRYPLIVKPLTRDHRTWKPLARAKVIEIATPADLAAIWPRLAEAGIDVLVQELVPGPETLIESYHVYVDADGAVAAEFAGRKIRTYPAHHGYSTALEIADLPDVVSVGRDVMERVGLRGVAKLDFKRHPQTGELFLLEINPRFNLWHHPGARAGVNIPAIVYADLTGRPRPATGRATPGVRWCSPWRDVRAARDEGIPLYRWVMWLAGVEAKSAVSWDDPLPLIGGSVWRLRHRRHRPGA